MPWKTWALIFLAASLIITGASASCLGDAITLTSSNDWVIANKSDSSLLTAQLTNTSGSCTYPDATPVTFAISSPVYGSLTSYSGITASGIATTTFKTNTTSGTVDITATANGKTATYPQKIDHDTPYYVTFDYQDEVIVNETTTLIAKYTDRWSNLIDNRRIVESVYFAISSPGNGAGFYNGASFVDETVLSVDATGSVSTLCKVDSVAGQNIIYMQHLGSISDKYLTVYGISEAIPFSLITAVSPTAYPNPYVPADGESIFSLQYTLFDAFGNPASNRSIWLNTSLAENVLLRSNSLGEIYATYGPKETTGSIIVTAIVVDNTTLTSTVTLEFVSTDPVNMLLTANPGTMPSYDVAPTATASIMAKVMDISGNPVAGETVTFALGTVSYDETYNATYINAHLPTLLTTTAVTDSDGYAIVEFRPGGFTQTKTNLNYDQTATGHAIVTATWDTTVRTMTVNWMNYPYLSVETSVEPSTVAVGDTVDVKIELKGDGWALQPDPIDVVLCTDRSGSMMYDNPDRMTSIMAAMKTFVGSLNLPRDFIGIVSFGNKGTSQAYTYMSCLGPGSDCSTSDDSTYVAANYPGTVSAGVGKHYYSDYATVDLTLTNSAASVNDTIRRMIPYSGTPMRQAVYLSVNEMVSKGHAGSVKAIIVLSDGDYNWYGDPLARGTGYTSYGPTDFGDLTSAYYKYSSLTTTNQNMSNYAKNNGITIYSIAYGNSISSGGKTTLKVLAEGTGGKYYTASATDIADVYTDIAGELKTAASVNTTMNIVASNVEVNEVSFPGGDVFNYIYVDGVSTHIQYPNGTSITINQTSSWVSPDYKLSFNVGEIKLGQIWNTTFRLRVLKPGNINLFGDDSEIKFDGDAGPSTLNLEPTYITAVENIDDTGFYTATLDLKDIKCTKTGLITDFIPVEWAIDYTGDSIIVETIKYSIDDDDNDPNDNTWITFDTHHLTKATVVDAANLDVREKPAGKYFIRVVGTASDSATDTITLDIPIEVGSKGTKYIKLE